MKRKLFSVFITAVLMAVLFSCGNDAAEKKGAAPEETVEQPVLGAEEKPMLEADGFQFKDLNENGELDPYEDWRLSDEERTEDLLARMTAEEKAGLMLHGMMNVTADGVPEEKDSAFISDGALRFAVARLGSYNPTQVAQWCNSIQKTAEKSRLGIPFVVSVDPIHYYTPGSEETGFTQFPQPLGFGATMDPTILEEFGKIAAVEYRAVGITMGLSPMADLATEPRWSRISGTFSEDSAMAADMTAAYIRGFQGESLRNGVACMVKHFPGGGPQEDGWDSHFNFGKYQVYPGNNMAEHLKPFEAAFDAGVASVMPYYSVMKNGEWGYDGIIDGKTTEQVGIAYNSDVINGLLREKYGFDKLVCSDWMILYTPEELGYGPHFGPAFGVEELSMAARVGKAVKAGIDQFGGQSDSAPILEAHSDGLISDEDLNRAARRALHLIFSLGLFENPYVNAEEAMYTCGSYQHKQKALATMYQSVVLLKNKEGIQRVYRNATDDDGNLVVKTENLFPAPLGSPYSGGPATQIVALGFENTAKFFPGQYSNDITPAEADFSSEKAYWQAVLKAVNRADMVFFKISGPQTTDERTGFFKYSKETLEYGNADNADVLDKINDIVNNKRPADHEYGETQVVVMVSMDRPSVLREFEEQVDGIIVDFGATDKVVMDLAYGVTEFSGKLPVGLPASDAAVQDPALQKEDVAGDGTHKVYQYGFSAE